MKWNQVYKVTVNSAITSATLLIIVAGATCFGRYLTFQGIPGMITESVVGTIEQPWIFLLAINILLLVVGMFMDIISATLILTPIFLPILYQYNINVLHFGLLMTVNLGIGYCTPPLGVSLYITGALANRNLLYVTRAVIPFFDHPDLYSVIADLLAVVGFVPAQILLRHRRLIPRKKRPAKKRAFQSFPPDRV